MSKSYRLNLIIRPNCRILCKQLLARYCHSRSIAPITQIYNENRSQQYEVNKNMITKVASVSTPYNSLRLSTIDLLSYFLPKGYPQSVNKGYDAYIVGQFVGNLFSSVGAVLSIQSLLLAMGIGNAALPAASTLNWVIKDGIGQLGGVIFASAISNRFDSDPKRWRFLASSSLELSSFIELLTPLAPHYFLLMASIANIGKNISYLSASASRAALHKSFAIHENLADITAKSGSQTICSSMIGTGIVQRRSPNIFIGTDLDIAIQSAEDLE
eukprot:gene9273-19251_t